jgi:hypothetical protein
MNESATSTAGESNASAAAPKPGLLPLDLAERVIMVKARDSGTNRRHIFRRVNRQDVDAYYSWMTVATERKSKNSMDYSIDMRTAKLKLHERLIERVEGYPALGDGRDIMALENWKERVPGAHRLRAVELLQDVKQSKNSSEIAMDAEADIVSLDALWSAGDFGMFFYRGLIHRFSPPALADWRKLNDRSTRTTVVPGSRSQKTTYPKLNGVLLELYDSLILSAEGYSVGGQPIASREECISEMDCLHKIEAVSVLFNSETGADDTEESEEG